MVFISTPTTERGQFGHSSDYSVRIVGALKFIQQAPLSLNLHVNAATSGVDINAFLCGGKADYHTGRI
jgi:hypothetical protein